MHSAQKKRLNSWHSVDLTMFHHVCVRANGPLAVVIDANVYLQYRCVWAYTRHCQTVYINRECFHT